jgi:branched-chain amino acid transport system substrate-binding protein
VHITGIVRGIAAACLAVTAAGSAGAQDTVKIGLVMPMTGALGTTGTQIVAGARLYVRLHGHTVAGKKIELIVRDERTSFDVGKRLIQELIVNDNVDIIGGGLTGDMLAAAPLISEARRPTVIMLAGTSGLVDKSPYFVRTSFTLAQSSSIIADWASKNGIARAATLVTDFSAGHEAEASFKSHFLAAGGQIATSIHVPLQNPDFSPFLQRVRDVGPNAVFVFIPAGQGNTFAKQFVERGMDKAGIKLIGPGDLTDDDVLPQMGDAIIGAVTAHFYSAAHPSIVNREFLAAFAKEYGKRPNFMAVSGYDGMHLIYDALRKTNGATNGEVLISAMKGTAWESPRGPMSIDPATGDVVHDIYVRRVERVNGELYNVEFATFDAVKDPMK